MSEKGRKEARIGLDAESELLMRVNEDMNFRKRLTSCLRRLGFRLRDVRMRKDGVKVDLVIESRSSKIGVSLKTSTRTSFHQLDRRRLEEWRDVLSMPDDIYWILRRSILRKASNRRAPFIEEEDREEIRDFFSAHLGQILEEIFRRGEQVDLLAIYNKRARKLYIFRMDDVLTLLRSSEVSFSPRGIIRLGPFITVQRKGGDGRRVKVPKTDWRHPGNQLQFKFSPLKFVEWARGRIPHCELDL